MENSQQTSKYKTIELIKNSKSIIWDFDGVIKDSVDLKGEAFKKLFDDQKIFASLWTMPYQNHVKQL